MKTIELSDELISQLEQILIEFGISPDEIVRRGISEYLRESNQQFSEEFDVVGFGMWSERRDMEDSVEWVNKIREQEWKRL
jgi:hypothetical protein